MPAAPSFEDVVNGSLTLKDARIKSVKADLLAGTVTVSFVLTLDEATLQARRHLQYLSMDEDTTLDLTIIERRPQLSFAPDEKTTATLAATGPDGEPIVVDFDKAYAAVMSERDGAA